MSIINKSRGNRSWGRTSSLDPNLSPGSSHSEVRKLRLLTRNIRVIILLVSTNRHTNSRTRYVATDPECTVRNISKMWWPAIVSRWKVVFIMIVM